MEFMVEKLLISVTSLWPQDLFEDGFVALPPDLAFATAGQILRYPDHSLRCPGFGEREMPKCN
jgi:hypothetical protein